MPGLTVTEKEHWKNRIAQRIDRRIEALWAIEPNLQDRIEREAREQALASLGLADFEAEHAAIERQTEANERRQRELAKLMLATVRRVPVEQLGDYYSYQHDQEVDSAVARRQQSFADRLLAESPTGKQVLELRAEKDRLLDTVWLATSSASVKTLWEKVGRLLGDDTTVLEREALAIPPETDVS